MLLSTSTNILFERKDDSRIDVKESIQLCAAAGYRYLDFCFVDQIFTPVKTRFTTDDWRAYMQEIAQESAALGIQFTQCRLPIHDFCNPTKNDETTLALVHRSLESAAMLGIHHAAVHPSSKTQNGAICRETLTENKNYFKALASLAKQYDIHIDIENMWGKTKDGVRRYAVLPDELASLVDAVDRENVGICWDTMHGSIEGLDQGAALRVLGNRVTATHISDENGADFIHTLPYTGRCQWGEIMQALVDIHYEGNFNYELQHFLWEVPETEFSRLLQHSIAVAQGLIAQYNEKREYKRL